MRNMSGLHRYMWAVILAGLLVWVASAVCFGWAEGIAADRRLWLLTALTVVMMRYPLLLQPGTRFGTKFDVSTLPVFAVTLLYPPPIAGLSVALAVAMANVSLKRSTRNTLFNVAQYVLCVVPASWAFYALRVPEDAFPSEYLSLVAEICKVVLVGLVQYSINTALVSVATGIHTRRPIVPLWLEQRRYDFLSEAVLMLMAFTFVALGESAPWVILLGIAAALLVYRHMEQYLQKLQSARRFVEDLVTRYEQLRPRVRGHTQRVADLSVRIATLLGLSAEEVESIRAAALVHDIGLLNFPALDAERLHPQEPLDPDVWDAVSVHPQLGAQIVGRFPLYAPLAPIIAAHHERWDGLGYPRQLQALEIPLGARVLALADGWDSLLYGLDGWRKCSPIEAYGVILSERGLAYDPAVVDALLGALEPRLRLRIEQADLAIAA